MLSVSVAGYYKRPVGQPWHLSETQSVFAFLLTLFTAQIRISTCSWYSEHLVEWLSSASIHQGTGCIPQLLHLSLTHMYKPESMLLVGIFLQVWQVSLFSCWYRWTEIRNCGADGKAILCLFPWRRISGGDLVLYFCKQLFLVLFL